MCAVVDEIERVRTAVERRVSTEEGPSSGKHARVNSPPRVTTTVTMEYTARADDGDEMRAPTQELARQPAPLQDAHEDPSPGAIHPMPESFPEGMPPLPAGEAVGPSRRMSGNL